VDFEKFVGAVEMTDWMQTMVFVAAAAVAAAEVVELTVAGCCCSIIMNKLDGLRHTLLKLLSSTVCEALDFLA